MAYDGAAGTNPYAGLDVERVFAAVELLAERRTLEVTPFVSAWHPAVDAHDRNAQLPSFWDRKLRDALLRESPFDSARDLIAELARQAVGHAGDGTRYRRLAEGMIAALRSLVHVEAGSTGYLLPLVRHGLSRGGLTIATLNYDRSIEIAAKEAGVPCYTGISHWQQKGGWAWPDSGVRLLKLHGSIDWCWDENRQQHELPRRTVVEVSDPTKEHRAPAVVFGLRGKLRPDGPFLPLLTEFENQLISATELLVVGYSFRDEHVNEVIRRWTLEDGSRTIRIVAPTFDPQHKSFGWDLVSHMGEGAYQIPKPRVMIDRRKASEALADLFLD